MSDGMPAAFAALHLGRDGPLPAALRAAAWNGGAARLGELRIFAESRHLDGRAARCRIALAGGAGAAVARELAAIRVAGLALRASGDRVR
jgi:hypothetical protein